MSVRPPEPTEVPSRMPPHRKKVTIQTLIDLHALRTPITMLTAYDYPTANLLSSSPLIDITLVGDSLAQVCLGYPSTTSLSLSEMIHHVKAVRRGTTHPFLIADMPFGSYQTSVEDCLRSAIRLVGEGGVEAVKIEGGSEVTDRIEHLTSMGIPVMGHVGLMPQRHIALSGYRVQGRSSASAQQILRTALSIQAAGAFALLLEAIPSQLASYITSRLSIPTIGIGAGPGTSGQVLVWDDAMGMWSGHKAKFVRTFANVKREATSGINGYAEAVRQGLFPAQAESYPMEEAEWAKFLEMEHDQDWESPKEQVGGSGPKAR